jgi:hypothetical protein
MGVRSPLPVGRKLRVKSMRLFAADVMPRLAEVPHRGTPSRGHRRVN